MVNLIVKLLKFHKRKTIPVILILIFSIALILINFNYMDYVKLRQQNKLQDKFGNVDLVLINKAGFSEKDITHLEEQKPKYLVQGINIMTEVVNEQNSERRISISGYDVDEYKEVKNIISEESQRKLKDGNNIIMKDTTLKLLGLSVGDNIKLGINNAVVDFNIIDIVDTQNKFIYFDNDGLVELTAVKKGFGIKDYVNEIVLDFNRQEEKVNALTDYFHDNGQEVILNNLLSTYNEAAKDSDNIIMMSYTLTLACILVAFLVIYNIYSTLIIDRMNDLVTLKVLGISKKSEVRLWLIEAGIVALISVAAGSILGIGISYLTISDSDIKLTYFSVESLMFCVLTAFLPPLLAIIKNMRQNTGATTAELLLNVKGSFSTDYKQEKKISHTYINLIIIIAALVAVKILNLKIQKASINKLLDISDIIIFVFLCCELGTIFIELILKGNKGLTLKVISLKRKQVSNLLSILVVCIMLSVGFSSMVNSIKSSITEIIDDTFNYKYIVEVSFDKGRAESLERALTNNDIKDYGFLNIKKGTAFGEQIWVNYIKPDQFSSLFKYSVDQSKFQEISSKFIADSKNAIISYKLADSIGVREKDKVSIFLDNAEENINVIGTSNFIGNFVYLPVDNLMEGNQLLIKDNISEDKLYKALNEVLSSKEYRIKSLDAYKEQEVRAAAYNVEFLSRIIKALMVVSVVIFMSSLNLNIIQHRKDFALLRVLGARRKRIYKTILAKGILYGTSSLVFGLLCAVEFNVKGMELLSRNVHLPLNSYFNIAEIAVLSALFLVLIGISLLFSALNIRKLNLVSAIKVE